MYDAYFKSYNTLSICQHMRVQYTVQIRSPYNSFTRYLLRRTCAVGTFTPDLIHWIESISRSINAYKWNCRQLLSDKLPNRWNINQVNTSPLLYDTIRIVLKTWKKTVTSPPFCIPQLKTWDLQVNVLICLFSFQKLTVLFCRLS